MTQNEIKALIEDLRLNHEFCPKEVILQAADELERMQQGMQEPVAWNSGVPPLYPEMKDGEIISVEYAEFTPPAAQPVPVKTYSGGKPWPVAPKPWVGLTNQERSECWETIPELAMKKVEAKLKEKNT
jgi:hypothetical protein